MKLSILKIPLLIFLFLVVGFGIYGKTFKVPFLFDDTERIVNNTGIRITSLSFDQIKKAAFSKKGAQNRPIGNISFALNYYFHKYDLFGYHLVNIIIHWLSGIFLYFLIRITLSILESRPDVSPVLRPPLSSYIAFFAALLWFVNPLHTQSITYVVQRLNSMAAMFFLLSLLCYVKGRLAMFQKAGKKMPGTSPDKEKETPKKSRTISGLSFLWFLCSALAWVFAMGCKQIAATLPFYVYLYEWYFFQDLKKEWLKRHLKYLIAIIVLFLISTMVYSGLDLWKMILSDYARKDFTMGQRVLTEFRVVIYYLSLVFYPHPSRLNVDYDYPLSHSLVDPVTTLLSLLTIILLIGSALYMAKRERLISFCVLWFFGNLAIESSVIGLAIIFEHRTYLPSMLVFLIIVTLAFRYIPKKSLVAGVLCAIAVLFSFWTYQRNEVWKDGISLWSDSVKKAENKARPRINLGGALLLKGRLEEALAQYNKALQLDPDYAVAYCGRGLVLEAQGKLDEAIGQYQKAVDMRPRYATGHFSLGLALAKKGDLREAMNHYIEALRTEPNYAEAHNALGIALFDMGMINEALGHFYEASRIKPDYAEPHYNIGNILKARGQLDDAIDHFSRAIRISPDYAKAHHNLGIAYVYKGRFDDAIKHLSEAVRIDPDYAEAHNNLGVVLQQKGMLKEAAKHYAEALRINPDYTDARDNLEQISQ